ncbi:MAG: SIS domain-containing protein [Candidatus Omnitrophica bacterium]|nr:SIS domain-containing protein [Candidatus Omnitrophota bacterium]MDD5573878.1 SIS domain-containing protein [Candidatus Omnitrophota bacterium]
MTPIIKSLIQDSLNVSTKVLQDEDLVSHIEKAAGTIVDALKSGHKVLIFGNGGSAADSQHFAAELVSRFQKEREAYAAVALTTDTSLLSAIGNDYDFGKVFMRQIEALGRSGDIAFAISTSGNAKNVLAAVQAAKTKGLKTIALTGGTGGGLAQTADLALIVPSKITARIQEAHILIIHIICHLIENRA